MCLRERALEKMKDNAVEEEGKRRKKRRRKMWRNKRWGRRRGGGERGRGGEEAKLRLCQSTCEFSQDSIASLFFFWLQSINKQFV